MPALKLFLMLLIISESAFGCSQAAAPIAELSLPKTAAPGGKIKGTVTLTFEPGLHGYQNPPTKDFMIPVTIASLSKGVAVRAQYPTGQMKIFAGDLTAVYEGTIEIPVSVTLPNKPGMVTVKLNVSYQQCNDQACFPPETLTLMAKVQVKKPAKK